MSRCIILHQNESDSATITVANTATKMGADNLKTDVKSEVCRIMAGNAQIDALFPSPAPILSVVLPASNLGPNSTIRVRVYSSPATYSLAYDTGIIAAAPGADDPRPSTVNEFSSVIAPIVAVHLPQHVTARLVRIDIADPDATHIDIARLIIGPAVTPTYSATYGASIGIRDNSSHSIAASGDIKTDHQPRARTLQFDLKAILREDRPAIRKLMDRGVGQWMYVSLIAGCGDPVLERDYSIYGKLKSALNLSWASFGIHNTSFSVDGF